MGSTTIISVATRAYKMGVSRFLEIFGQLLQVTRETMVPRLIRIKNYFIRKQLVQNKVPGTILNQYSNLFQT